jgi:hypothetical protein
MKQITVGFSKASTSFPIFSWLILWTQGTPYSHVYLKYTDEVLNQTMYYQASHTVVNSMDEATFLGQETVIEEFSFDVSDAAFQAWMQFAANNAGLPYGTLEILGLLCVQIASLVGIKMHNPLKEAGATWICDQLIAAGLQSCDNITLPKPLNDMVPEDVFNLVSSLPKTLT